MSQTPDHSVRTHHKYGMSKLNALDFCPGYRSKDEPSEASDEGTYLHEIMDMVAKFLKTQLAQKLPTNALTELESALSCGFHVDEDQQYYLESCCKELQIWLDKKPTRIENEIKVTISHPDGSELNHGHLDLLLFFSNGVATLIDWKFGWIPVPPAEINLQGKGYACASFQKFPTITKICSVFVQPKLHTVTRKVFNRGEVFDIYQRIRGVIDNAERADKTLREGPYCDFCEHGGTCIARVKSAVNAVVKYEGLPLPDIFNADKIQTPEQAAIALYCIERLESFMESGGVKAKALEFAKQAGGRLDVPIPGGQNIVIEVKGRKASRSANSPALIAEALQDVLQPEQVLGCCDPVLGKLEEVYADTLVARRKAQADEVLKEASLAAAATPDRKRAKAILENAKAKAKDLRLTKKRAYEILDSVLRSEGLLSAPDHLIEFLKVRLEKNITPNTATQITQ